MAARQQAPFFRFFSAQVQVLVQVWQKGSRPSVQYVWILKEGPHEIVFCKKGGVIGLSYVLDKKSDKKTHAIRAAKMCQYAK
jgi:hypothetical protein